MTRPVRLAGRVGASAYSQDMFGALLPGVREFRTPLVTGALWATVLWLLIGEAWIGSEAAGALAERFEQLKLPQAVWLAAACLVVYLIGSLLIVRRSPFRWASDRLRPRFQGQLWILDSDEAPDNRRQRLLRRLWMAHGHRQVISRTRRWIDGGDSDHEIDPWLYNLFDNYAADGRIPVMRSFDGGCGAPNGFENFYSSRSVENFAADTEPYDRRSRLASCFVDEVKREKPAVEVRIQMRFPEVYAEIDRLKVEAELRMSIFWPLVVLVLTVSRLFLSEVGVGQSAADEQHA